MNNLKKALCALLAGCTLMTGCGGNSTSTSTSDSGASSTSENGSASAEDSGTDNTNADNGAGVVAEKNIYIEGTKFMLEGEEIWLNGMNAPWQKWNDFGGAYNAEYWDKAFEKMAETGINACRIWIDCNGTVGVQIEDDGTVIGATDKHWQDLDSLFSLAAKHEIYIMATLMSFDHFKNAKQDGWRAMMQNNDKIDTYIDNYVIPFCKRYDSNDYVWSIDLINEPDWVIENEECGKLPWDALGNYFARASAAIHENTDDMLVTVGIAMIKYNSTKFDGNYASDEYLQKLYNNENAYVDYWSPHYYDWMASWYGVPFEVTAEEFGIDLTKPCVVGECSHEGVNIRKRVKPLEDCYEWAYNNGWNGVFGWTDRDLFSSADGLKQFEAVKLAASRIVAIENGTYVPTATDDDNSAA